jgi:hypothetical protein
VIGDNHKVTAARRANLHSAVLMQVVFANSESTMILGRCKSELGNVRAYRPVLSPLPTAFRTPTFTYQLLDGGFCFLAIITCSGIRLCGLVLFQLPANDRSSNPIHWWALKRMVSRPGFPHACAQRGLNRLAH